MKVFKDTIQSHVSNTQLEPTLSHKMIVELRTDAIVTTNMDLLLELAFHQDNIDDIVAIGLAAHNSVGKVRCEGPIPENVQKEQIVLNQGAPQLTV
ncbi:MAG: hypothetical protein HN356_16025 [Calditrichaeota bacterium]|jgi:hypothetical protein|nr:hypothetical protein [Calditrichota bacterium]